MYTFITHHAYEIGTIIAELIVAAIIYLEVDHDRQVRIFSKATEKSAAEARAEIYITFTALEGSFSSMAARSKAFAQLV
jgi:hypothetical protein